MLFCVEAILARDQAIVDEWFRNEIDSEELRERIRFDTDWEYHTGALIVSCWSERGR